MIKYLTKLCEIFRKKQQSFFKAKCLSIFDDYILWQKDSIDDFNSESMVNITYKEIEFDLEHKITRGQILEYKQSKEKITYEKFCSNRI